MEAIACGTPVVGFPVGGVPEMVIPDVTGWLAKELTAESLYQSLLGAREAIGQGRHLRRSCRAAAEEHYCDTIQAHRYHDVFDVALGKWGR